MSAGQPMSRFQAIGSYVYERGKRIGITTDEAADELACKLNAYQMRVQRFKAENSRLKAEVEQMESHYESDTQEIARLQAQVERLTKAGDAMAEQLDGLSFDNVLDFWNAAKEGKQP